MNLFCRPAPRHSERLIWQLTLANLSIFKLLWRINSFHLLVYIFTVHLALDVSVLNITGIVKHMDKYV